MDINLEHETKKDGKENVFKSLNMTGDFSNKGTKDQSIKKMEMEIEFEVNKLLKQEIVDLKLELEKLKKEKDSWQDQANKKTRDLVLQKQNLENINVSINKGKPTKSK